MQRHGLASPRHSPSAEARVGAEVGGGRCGGPSSAARRRWVCQASCQGGGGEEGGTPGSPPQRPGRLRPPRGSRVRRLPAAWPVGTPPSARQSERPPRSGGWGCSPRPSPSASHQAGRLPPAARPLPLPGPATWAPPTPAPQPRACPSTPSLRCGSGHLHPGARSPTHITAAAQLLQRDVHGGVRAGGTLGLPAAGPRPGRGLGPRPGPTAARHHSRCHSPSLGRRHPRLPGVGGSPRLPRRCAWGRGRGGGEERPPRPRSGTDRGRPAGLGNLPPRGKQPPS